MKNFLFILITGLAIGALITFLLMRSCNPEPPVQIVQTSDTFYLPGDIVKTVDTIPKPYPVAVLVPEYLPAVIDTPAIIAHYYTINIYDQVLKDDSSAYIRLIDTLNQNLLHGRYMEFMNRRQTAIIHNTATTLLPQTPKLNIYAGLGLSSSDTLTCISLPGMLTYNRQVFMYSYIPRLRMHEIKILFSIIKNPAPKDAGPT